MNLDSLPIERVKVLSAASSSSFFGECQVDVSARYMTLISRSRLLCVASRALQEIHPDNVNNEKTHPLFRWSGGSEVELRQVLALPHRSICCQDRRSQDPFEAGWVR